MTSLPVNPNLPPDVANTVHLALKTWKSRLTFSSIAAAIGCVVMDPMMVAAWLAVVLIWEFWLSSALYLLTLRSPLLSRFDLNTGFWLSSGATGSWIYAAFGYMAWVQGGQLGIQVATLWLCGSGMHLFVYFSRHMRLLLVHLAAPVCAIVAAAITTSGLNLHTALMLVTTLTFFFATRVFATDRNALLEELNDHAIARAEAEAENGAKSQFLATMSHELRTPLNAIIGYSEIIEEDIEAGAMPRVTDARKVKMAAGHLLGLINEVLDLSKLDAGRMTLSPEPTDVNMILRDVRDTLAPLANANGNVLSVVSTLYAKDYPVDQKRLRQCLLNLGSNACKFTEGGQVVIVAAEEDGWLRFEVRDTGPGISPEAQEALFKPFSQLDGSLTRKHEGTGLGLAITRKLAQLMAGDVQVQSAAGQGATFTLRIPRPSMSQKIAA